MLLQKMQQANSRQSGRVTSVSVIFISFSTRILSHLSKQFKLFGLLGCDIHLLIPYMNKFRKQAPKGAAVHTGRPGLPSQTAALLPRGGDTP